MEKVTIIALIYQSVHYAKFLYEGIKEYTPEDHEFYFIANDATDEVKKFLKENNYPHYVLDNPHYSEEERFEKGFAYPEYCGRVYMGYNFGIKKAQNDVIVWVNSDNAFSPNWLTNLLKRLTKKTVVSPRIVQPCPFPNPINHSVCEVVNFGTGIESYNEAGFQKWVKNNSKDSISIGNAFFPAMIHKENVEKVGYFPEGNLHAGDYMNIRLTGDTWFYLRLSELGIRHITSNDSIIYHFNEGEKYKK